VGIVPHRPCLFNRLPGHLVVASVVSFFNLPDDTICAYIGAGEVVVLKARTTRDLDRWATGSGDRLMGGSSCG
jgi:carbohydrate diacid regulator